MKCLDKLIILFSAFLRISLMCSIVLALAWYCFSLPAKSAENPYWVSLRSKVDKYLSSALDPQQYAYEIIGLESPLQDYLGKSPDATVEFSGLVPSSRQQLRVITASTRNPIEQARINVKLYSYISAWIADADIPAGSPLSAVHQERIKVSPADLQMVISADKLNYDVIKNKIANHKILKGESVKSNAIKTTKLVSLGDPITMVSESSLIRLEFKCKAMGNGDIGDEITLNCPDLTKKNPKVQITGANLAILK